MAIYGVTDVGFSLKRLVNIVSEMALTLGTVEDVGSGENLTPNLSDENDPLVQIINAISDALSVMWEQLQLAYNQFDPLKASGAGLSGLVQLNNLRRRLGSKVTVTFLLTGTPSKTMAPGVQISDMANLYVFTLPSFTFDLFGIATVIGTCAIKGTISTAPGTLVNILTPISGLISATNTDDSTGGSSDESDIELRARQQISQAGTGKSVIDTVYSVLAGLPDVTHVRVYQNRTLTEDERGLPPKSVAVVILGGNDEEISAAIFGMIPLGVETYGTTITSQTDVQGISYPVLFTRPMEIDIFVEVDIEIIIPSLWMEDGDANIKSAIVSWATLGASGVGIDIGYDRNGYIPGESIYASELYTPVNKQLGIRISDIRIGINLPAMENKIEIFWDEIAKFSTSNIYISYVSDSSI